MPVHPIASQGFGAEADTYERSRPSYPVDLVSWLVATLRVGPGTRLVDLAAGTGILTALLAERASVVAVEPVAGMLEILRRKLPAVPVVRGVAEALPFASGSLDAVTVAQAFHWFDPPKALAELRRCLRKGGRFAVVWNARDRSVDWVDAVWSVMDRVEKRAPWRDHDGGTRGADAWRDEALARAPGFGEGGTAQFQHVQLLGPEGVVDRIRGVSHVAVLSAKKRDRVLAEVREIVTTHPSTRGRTSLAVPYRVDAYWHERS